MPEKKQAEAPEEFPSTQDQSRKRQNIASKAVRDCEQFWDSLQELSELSLERTQSGNFVDADFTGTALAHLTPFLVGLLLDTVVPAIKTFMEAPISGTAFVPRDIVIQMKS